MATLGLVGQLAGHVVAQVIEAELVVGAVGDVGPVRRPLLDRAGLETGDHETDFEAEVPVDATHPLGVETSEVVVDGDEVHTLTAEPVEVGRQRRHEGLAFTRLHLRDPPEVQGGSAHQLHVEVALADDTHGGLAHDGEGLHGDVVEVGTVGESFAKCRCLGLQIGVAQPLHLGFEGVDVRHHALQGFELLSFASAEDAVEDSHAAYEPTGRPQR